MENKMEEHESCFAWEIFPPQTSVLTSRHSRSREVDSVFKVSITVRKTAGFRTQWPKDCGVHNLFFTDMSSNPDFRVCDLQNLWDGILRSSLLIGGSGPWFHSAHSWPLQCHSADCFKEMKPELPYCFKECHAGNVADLPIRVSFPDLDLPQSIWQPHVAGGGGDHWIMASLWIIND